jgi:hypothetical protein
VINLFAVLLLLLRSLWVLLSSIPPSIPHSLSLLHHQPPSLLLHLTANMPSQFRGTILDDDRILSQGFIIGNNGSNNTDKVRNRRDSPPLEPRMMSDYGSTSDKPTASSSKGGGISNFLFPSSKAKSKSSSYNPEEERLLIESTLEKQYQSEGVAAGIMNSLAYQRESLLRTTQNAAEITVMTQKARLELKVLQHSHVMKRRKLYAWIGVLAVVDFAILWRIFQCGGSLFCR